MANVLLADDDATTRDLVARALTADGHTVTMAADGQDALDQIAASTRPFDVLVTDVQMPVIDGITLAQQVLAAQPAIRIVLMSGLHSEMARADRLKGPQTRFVLKPFTLDQIRAEIRQLLA